MTNTATAVSQTLSTSQLPVSWYHDLRMFELEQRLLFARAPLYVGHEMMVPYAGDYRCLERFDQSRVLIHRADEVALLSNVCRHRQAVMLQGHGQIGNIVCPVHRWAYDTHGTLLGAPHFPNKPCLNLHNYPLQRWQGLLFEEGSRQVAKELASVDVEPFDFSGYVLNKVMINECHYNWKTFIEVYLEDYHVEPYHPGLNKFVDCDDLVWQFGEEFSMQTVGLRSLQKAGTKTYQRWHEAVMSRFTQNENLPKRGAIWMAYYPGLMIEWYPHVLVVSTLLPRGPQHTTNIVEFYYPESISLFEQEFVDAEQEAYIETAKEDDEIAELLDRGRKALMLEGRDDAGPYQEPMEIGMKHFHNYLHSRLDDEWARQQTTADNR